ncbi:ADP-ribosylglycohydrolase family protein [Halobaculum litoreum]|uniref:ADP-ribosylglycohydrolase family protein n=1 Tax=Halobaculum litoreum TaxID=3031998 RepID=A0ABD5XYN0_9EURY|nr:ADP-ribosylglycohydrolase family protein [Halobaculum sp. DT92]
MVGALVDGATVDAALATARTAAVERGVPVPVRETLAVVGDRSAVTLATDGDAVDLLETALHEGVPAADVEEATVAAVSRGGAAGALGAVAGAVAGARHGRASVPARWHNDLDRTPEDLAALAAGLAASPPRS